MFNLKTFINNWLNKIKVSDNQAYIDEIDILKEKLTEKSKENDSLRVEEQELINEMQDMDLEITNLKAKIKELTTDTEVQKPNFLIGIALYQPKRRVVSKNFDVHIVFQDPKDVFDKSHYLSKILKAENLTGLPKTISTAQKIMTFINSQIKYEQDAIDNWRPVADTLLAGFGDCDDSGGVALTSAFGICGWADDEVFCAVGFYHKNKKEKFCHAYCTIKIEGIWYIAEGTEPKAKLFKWKDLQDKYTADYGLFNWKFQGSIKKDINSGLFLDNDK